MPISQIVTNSIANGAVVAADLAAGAALSNLGTSQLADANMAPGSVIQVVQATKTDTQGINASGWTSLSGLSLNITPSSTSSRILIMAQVQVGGSETLSVDAGLALYRDATIVIRGDAAGSRTRTSTAVGARARYEINSNTIAYVDSPATTSSTNYNIQIFRSGTDGTLGINREVDDGDSPSSFRTTSTLIAMEIAG
jgi:hypothetical protein